MFETGAGLVAVRTHGEDDIQLRGRQGTIHATYKNFCTCRAYLKYIAEIPDGLAELCQACNEIKVVNMVTRKMCKAFSGSGRELKVMCGFSVDKSLLVWDDKSKCVIHLKWDASTENLKKVGLQTHV